MSSAHWLEAEVPPPTASIGTLVERRLEELFRQEQHTWSAVDPRLCEPLAALCSRAVSGGKRLRPLFAECGFRAAGGHGGAQAIVDIASALELLHTFALLHDDVMDGSGVRRGRPALHVEMVTRHRTHDLRGEPRRYGEGVAVLLGDLAFALADRLMATTAPAVRAVWSQLRIELMMGQYLDVEASASGAATVPEARRVARLKSGGYTVERPLHLGAAAMGGLDRLERHLSAYGRPLGEAFQLRDDLLGVFGDPAVTGKPVGEDIREGKQTVLLGLARRLTSGADRAMVERAGRPGLTDPQIQAISAVIDACGARRMVEERIDRQYEAALEALDRAPLADDVRADLEAMAYGCSWRAA